ncbi:uncharacterized protein LOC115323483 [Ixodes scapularis]|uniref:uncharacterized protein LOC115323483 n=1 Tax=Ixodes scapularis TaxID=6945 RepID=UPI001A9FA59E|nr:uncharacterized protein LOC115323483 [Ixodes scapularis]
MTPKKLKIFRAALRAYIGNKSEEEVGARLAKTNAYLANYVQDTSSRWKKAQRKKSQEAAAEAEEMALLSILSPLQRPTSPSVGKKGTLISSTPDMGCWKIESIKINDGDNEITAYLAPHGAVWSTRHRPGIDSRGTDGGLWTTEEPTDTWRSEAGQLLFGNCNLQTRDSVDVDVLLRFTSEASAVQ